MTTCSPFTCGPKTPRLSFRAYVPEGRFFRDPSDKVPTDTPWEPPVEIVEYADGHQITLEVPGIPKEQITIEVEGHTLTVSGTRTATLPEDTKVHRQERTFGQFRKSFTAGQTLDLANLTATTSNGLLTLRIPKLPSAQPRKIEVRETL